MTFIGEDHEGVSQVTLAMMRSALIEQVGTGHAWPKTPADDTNGIIGLLFPENKFEEITQGPICLATVGQLLIMFATVPGERLNRAEVNGRYLDDQMYSSLEVQIQLENYKKAYEKELKNAQEQRLRELAAKKRDAMHSASFRGFYNINSESTYPDLVLSEADIFLVHKQGDYDGMYTFLLRSKIDETAPRFGFLSTGYGSCSSCDALESCSSNDERRDFAKRLVEQDTHWFDSLDKLRLFLIDRDWSACDPYVPVEARDLAILRCSRLLGLTVGAEQA